jgi:hypothetical protein
VRIYKKILREFFDNESKVFPHELKIEMNSQVPSFAFFLSGSLSQDATRNFLISPWPTKLYELF